MTNNVFEIFGLLMGSGFVGYLFFYRAKKRKENATASALELQNINMVLEQKSGYIEDLKNEQIELKKEKEQLKDELKEARSFEAKERDKVVLLYKQLSNSNVKNVKVSEQLAIARFQKCEEATCVNRRPPKDLMEIEV